MSSFSSAQPSLSTDKQLNAKPLLSASQLSLSFQKHRLLDRINIHLFPNEIVGLIGANGAGKSSLMKVLLGIMQADHGQVLLGENVLSSLSRKAIAKYLSYVPQDTHLDFDFSVRDLVCMGRQPYLGAFSSLRQQDITMVDLALEAMDIDHLADQVASQLSGGERQRVFIARALAQESTLLMMDEPTANLDICHQLEVMQWLRRYVNQTSQAKSARACLIAIHDINLAARYCDRLILLDKGKCVAMGTPQTVLTPTNLATYFQIQGQVNVDQYNAISVSDMRLL